MVMSEVFWDERYHQEDCIWGVEPSITVKTCLTELKNRNAKKILDLGCGYGRDALYLAQHGFDVVGVDSSEKALNIGRQQAEAKGLAVKFLYQDALDLKDFSDHAFDAVVSHRFLHLILDINQQQAMVVEIYRVLKPDGIVSLSLRGIDDPSRNNSKQNSDGSEELAFRPGHKIKVMSLEGLRRLFQFENRFCVQSIEEFCELETEQGDIKTTLLHISAIKV